jgi:hypothetical protein
LWNLVFGSFVKFVHTLVKLDIVHWSWALYMKSYVCFCVWKLLGWESLYGESPASRATTWEFPEGILHDDALTLPYTYQTPCSCKGHWHHITALVPFPLVKGQILANVPEFLP